MDRRNRVRGVVSRKQAEMVAKKVGMTTEKVQELQDTFYVFDQNGDGMITTDELATVLFKLGQRPTLREVQAMIKSVDADKSVT
ncbi:Hypothetical predicted protein [Mytilus galloprovincialis]|uniref:EF-hand domain-containing protein n=1 Tax=Mytilus galloprovincialis TaxID=29158 RepID=A0A8B6EIP2_MYTGA|nr:Hypothetical predicted protein [Mytilus galloprovincialis]